MHRASILAGLIGSSLFFCTLWAQDPFREYPAWEYNNFPLPKDYLVPGEWTFARLMYPSSPVYVDWQSTLHAADDWHQGNTNWTIDYPRSDRHLALAIRRLTRIDARSAEQPVNLEQDDDVFNYPWLYAVEVGHWQLTDQMVAKFREFLDRGGFFMCDDFHGTQEWAVFTASLQKVFPDKLIATCPFNGGGAACDVIDLPKTEAIFHTIYDLDDKYQVPGAQYLRSHRTYEFDGYDPHWRGVYDARGRVVVAICNDMDLGDSWEWADDPGYDEKFSAMGFRIAANYLVYAMTH